MTGAPFGGACPPYLQCVCAQSVSRSEGGILCLCLLPAKNSCGAHLLLLLLLLLPLLLPPPPPTPTLSCIYLTGYKQSGLGRELGKADVVAFTEPQTLMLAKTNKVPSAKL